MAEVRRHAGERAMQAKQEARDDDGEQHRRLRRARSATLARRRLARGLRRLTTSAQAWASQNTPTQMTRENPMSSGTASAFHWTATSVVTSSEP